MKLEHEINAMLSKHASTDPQLFEALAAGTEAAVAASDLLGIILKQNALEQAVLRIAKRVDELDPN